MGEQLPFEEGRMSKSDQATEGEDARKIVEI
jgi:hypothetical protein